MAVCSSQFFSRRILKHFKLSSLHRSEKAMHTTPCRGKLSCSALRRFRQQKGFFAISKCRMASNVRISLFTVSIKNRIFRAKRQLSLTPINRTAALSNLTRPRLCYLVYWTMNLINLWLVLLAWYRPTSSSILRSHLKSMTLNDLFERPCILLRKTCVFRSLPRKLE